MTRSGSPPHARGIPCLFYRTFFNPGITPACAGNTMTLFPLSCELRDHPRMRGEYKWQIKSKETCTGSPPHARGIPLQILLDLQRLGITPACAGNTLKIPYKYRLFLKQKPTFRLTYYRSHMLYNNPLALYAFQLHQSRKNLLLFLTGSLIDLLIFCVLMQVYLYIHSLVTVIELFYMLLE